MFGTEAIWWLNSTLLAALTHLGVLWMLVVAEPVNTDQPVETKIIIESLPAAEDISKSQTKTEAQPVQDRVQPTKVIETENAAISSDSDQIEEVGERATIVKEDRPDERLRNSGSISDANVGVPNAATIAPTEGSDILPATSESATADKTPSAHPTTSQVQTEPTGLAKVTQTEQAETIEKSDAQLNSSEAALESSRISSVAADRPAGVKDIASSASAPSNSETATRVNGNSVSEKVAVLRQKPQPVQVTTPAKLPAVRQDTTTQPTNEKVQIGSGQGYVFPKNAKRLSPESTKPSKSVPSKRLAAVERETTAAADQDVENARSSPQRLKQVAIANSGRAGRVEPDGRYRDLLRFLEQDKVAGCATVLPTIARDGSVALSGFAADESLWVSFQESLTDELRIRLPLNAATVAKPQCRALTFARSLKDYPRFSLGMKLNKRDLVSGQSLEGEITDVRGRKIHLVVVDDEGLVQQIDNFLQPKVSSLTFSVALSVRNQVVPTAQMVIALAVERPLTTVTSANQTLAEQFFAAVTEELAATSQRADIAIVSFYLRSAN